MQFRQRHRLPLRVDLTPLIDVVFLLVLFFMLTTTFATQAGLDIDLPEADQSKSLNDRKKELTIVVSVDAWGHFYVQDKRIPGQELAQHLKEAADGDKNALIVVQGDKESKHGHIVKIMDTAQALGLTRLAIQTRVEGKKSLESK